MSLYKEKLIKANSVDDLVKKGIRYIQGSGERIWTTSGLALQSNNVTYMFLRNRRLKVKVNYNGFAITFSKIKTQGKRLLILTE